MYYSGLCWRRLPPLLTSVNTCQYSVWLTRAVMCASNISQASTREKESGSSQFAVHRLLHKGTRWRRTEKLETCTEFWLGTQYNMIPLQTVSSYFELYLVTSWLVPHRRNEIAATSLKWTSRSTRSSPGLWLLCMSVLCSIADKTLKTE